MAGLFGEYTLFSEVSGQIVDGDTPVSGAVISQSAKLGSSKAITQTTVTNSDGSFKLASITRKKGLSSLLPQQFAAGQSVTITVGEQVYEGWIFTKMDSAPNAENNGKPLRFVCDLSKEPDYRGKSFGICQLVQTD